MIAVILSIGIFIIFGAIVSAIIIGKQSDRKKRLMQVVRGEAMANSHRSAGDLQNQRRNDLAKKLKDAESAEGKAKKKDLSLLIVQAGLEMSLHKFWVYSLVSAVAFPLLAKIMGMNMFVVIMAAIIGFFGFPKFVLNWKAKRRQKAFMADFADSLEAMMRLLKAGMPVSEAIKMVAREYSGPIAEEMESIYEQQKIGVPLPEAVLESARRMPLTEMQMFATAIAIQTQTGSSLSEVLQNLANVIRSRFKLRRKVQALSSEAKASAMIIGALPIVVALGMYFINREYIEVLFIDPTGKFLLGCAVAWMGVGVLMMRQMINFKI